MAQALPTDWMIYDEMSRGHRMVTVRCCTLVTSITVAIFGGCSRLHSSALHEPAVQKTNGKQVIYYIAQLGNVNISFVYNTCIIWTKILWPQHLVAPLFNFMWSPTLWLNFWVLLTLQYYLQCIVVYLGTLFYTFDKETKSTWIQRLRLSTTCMWLLCWHATWEKYGNACLLDLTVYWQQYILIIG